jgi:hypothetical protein
MTTIKITNGLSDHTGKGILLTGTLTTGHVEQGDKLILPENQKIEIMEVEYDKETFPGTTHIVLTVSRDHKVVWHRLYGKEIKVEN